MIPDVSLHVDNDVNLIRQNAHLSLKMNIERSGISSTGCLQSTEDILAARHRKVPNISLPVFATRLSQRIFLDRPTPPTGRLLHTTSISTFGSVRDSKPGRAVRSTFVIILLDIVEHA